LEVTPVSHSTYVCFMPVSYEYFTEANGQVDRNRGDSDMMTPWAVSLPTKAAGSVLRKVP